MKPFALLPLLCLLVAMPSGPRAELFHEDFSSALLKDPVHTTACWDTAAGELRLPPYAMQPRGLHGIKDAIQGYAIDGDYAYLAIIEFEGFQVVDISDPDAPVQVGEIPNLSYPGDVELAGDLAYLACSYDVKVIDVSVPTKPAIVAAVPTPPYAEGLALAGDHAYVAVGNSGLCVLDITNPLSPSVVTTLDTPGMVSDVIVHGDYVFLVSGFYGVQVVDVSDPTAPVHVGGYGEPDSSCPDGMPGSAHDFTIAGDVAYLTETEEGLVVLDISNPTALTVIARLALHAHPHGIALAGDHAYVALGDNDHTGFLRLDVSDPADPRIVSEIALPGVPVDVRLAGELAYVNVAWGLQVVQVCDAVAPVRAAIVDTPGQAQGILIAGDLAYVGDGHSGLAVLDLSDPDAPAHLAEVDTDGHAIGLALSGDVLYVANGYAGLSAYDVSDPLAPVLLGVAETEDGAVAVAAGGDLAFVSCDYAGLAVFDVTDPADLVQLGVCDTDGMAMGMELRGDLLYLADGFEGMKVIDVSDPATPVIVGDTGPSGQASDLAVAGDHAFLLNGGWDRDRSGMLHVYDISDPTAPVEVGSIFIHCAPIGIEVVGDLAYVSGYGGLLVLDVSDPPNPYEIWIHDCEVHPYAVALAGDHAWVAGHHLGVEGVRVLDRLVDPAANVGQSLILPNSGKTVAWARLLPEQEGSAAWELSADGGMHWQAIQPINQWIHLEHPGAEPVWRATLAYDEPGLNPTVDALTLEWTSDPTATPEDAAPIFALHPAVPNPFNPETRLAFELPAAARARLEVFDAAGRRVATLLDAVTPAGRHEAVWRGLDDAGQPVGSGVYFSRLTAGGRAQTRKMLLLK